MPLRGYAVVSEVWDGHVSRMLKRFDPRGEEGQGFLSTSENASGEMGAMVSRLRSLIESVAETPAFRRNPEKHQSSSDKNSRPS
jgi:hypothetical protein